MQPREKTVVEKALDTFRKRTRIGADFLYEKTGTDLHGDGIVRLAHEGQQWDFKAEVKLSGEPGNHRFIEAENGPCRRRSAGNRLC